MMGQENCTAHQTVDIAITPPFWKTINSLHKGAAHAHKYMSALQHINLRELYNWGKETYSLT